MAGRGSFQKVSWKSSKINFLDILQGLYVYIHSPTQMVPLPAVVMSVCVCECVCQGNIGYVEIHYRNRKIQEKVGNSVRWEKFEH